MRGISQWHLPMARRPHKSILTPCPSSRVAQVWQYEGSNTLGGYLRRRDCIAGLAADLGVPEAAVVPTVMTQILENLQVHLEDLPVHTCDVRN